MPGRRVAEPYPIEDFNGRVRMAVRHRYVGGPHVGKHRAPVIRSHRRPPRNGAAYMVMVGLAAMPLVAVMLLPPRLLPGPLPWPANGPGFTNSDDRTTVPNQVPTLPLPERTTAPPPRTPTTPTKPPARPRPPKPAPQSASASPWPMCSAGLLPELPLATPSADAPLVKDMPCLDESRSSDESPP